jgi:hypothetical protein
MSVLNLKRKHEGLANYLQPIGAPGGVSVTGLQPRQPVAPGGAIPGGFRPIPTSSQRPKPTNATIVYARTAMPHTKHLGRVALSMGEGDLVFTERFAPALKDPMGQNVKAYSLQRINQEIEEAGPMDAAEFDKFFLARDKAFKYSPDGVVNNLDGEDPLNEYKDFAIANVAIQGFVRFSTLALPQKSARNGDKVFLALTEKASATEGKKTYKFEFFLASHVTTAKFDLDSIVKCWRLGRVVDGNQSKNMITLCVSVDPVADAALQLQREWLSGAKAEAFEKANPPQQPVAAAQAAAGGRSVLASAGNALVGAMLANATADAARDTVEAATDLVGEVGGLLG